MDPKLIILYGNVGKDRSSKVQRLVDGELTCGYREYAQHFGCIAYLIPVNRATRSWEHVFPRGRGVVEFCHRYSDAIVWSVKIGNPAKDALLRRIKNRKLYYSCGARQLINPACDISLVDTGERLSKFPQHARLWFKGKDPEFWRSGDGPKIYDYVVIGRPKSGKNQKMFVKQLARECPNTRTVLWIGGGEGRKQVGAHQFVSTTMLPPERVQDLLSLARVGVLFTQYRDEGFPQSLLEMTMCGVPVVYSMDGPYNPVYFSPQSAVRTNKQRLVETAEGLLQRANSTACRNYAASNYSLDASFGLLQKLAKEIRR